MHSPVDHVIIDSSLLQQHAGILDFSGGAGARVPVSALGARLYRTLCGYDLASRGRGLPNSGSLDETWTTFRDTYGFTLLSLCAQYNPHALRTMNRA